MQTWMDRRIKLWMSEATKEEVVRIVNDILSIYHTGIINGPCEMPT